ncbi:ABC transporter substrate-binding protein [Brenneria goodwinii]|uniref:Thiamine pyrimidine synthase n=1 Tax=Brenneria goodwinii TaxID=1109412 RepID=A0A0G4JX30_9GAMM|nr:ABC transporter substrate-binding protein [Brenneria goodwinii]CPR17992.1 Hydroxymethylpyrimidine ABC transporter, substrate-binding component [Brenneria goodwinii]
MKKIILSAFFLVALPVVAADKVKLQTDWLASGEHAAYYGGWAKGIYQQEGIDITVVRGYGSGDTVQKIGAGTADFGVADIANVLAARARESVPVKTIASLYTYSPHSLFVLKSSGIENFKGLEGKKIGITPGNSHKLFFPEVAKKSGTDPDKIIWVNMDGAAMSTQLLMKNIDAAPFYSIHWAYQNEAAKKIGQEIKVLPFVKEGFSIYSASLIASDKTLAERPELVRKFLIATKKAFEWANSNPEEACNYHRQKVPELNQHDCVNSLKAAMEFVFNSYQQEHGFGAITPERMKETWQAVSKAQDLNPNWDPAQAIDTRYLPE